MTSSGVVRVQTVDNVTLTSDAVMSETAATTGSTAATGGGMLAVNDVLGVVSASIEGSQVTTSGASSDVQVLAGDTSTVTARAETSALANGGNTAASAAATIALNTIGWQFAGGVSGILAASVDTLVGNGGSSDWTDEFPSSVTASGNTTNVTAKIVNSTISAAGALLLEALANGVVAATVTNVSQADSNADGNATSVAVGGLLGTNRVSRAASAFLSNVQPVSTALAVGAVTIDAENNASITSTSTLVTSAVAVSSGAKTTYTSDDTPGMAGATDLQYPDLSSANLATLQGTTKLNFGDTVLFQATFNTENIFGVSTPKDVTIKAGDTVEISPDFPSADGALDAVYEYTGPTTTLDLEAQDYADPSADPSYESGLDAGLGDQ